MELDDGILDQEESADPAEEEPNMLGWGGNNIFEQDDSAPSRQPSGFGMLQLLADVNTPTPEYYPEDCPPCSPTREAVLQTSDLDWVVEVEQAAPSQPEEEEETVEEGHYQDPCLPSPLREPIPREGCSKQRFKQESSQSEPDLREESVREMERTACHLDTSNTIAGQGPDTEETSYRCLGVCGQRMLRDWFMPRRNTVWPEANINTTLGKLELVSD